MLAWCGICDIVLAQSFTPFDKPLKTKIVALPHNPDVPSAKPKRTCFYYPGLMVKEVDTGNKGGDRLTITSYARRAPRPICAEKTAHEIEVPETEWTGYFAGVKSGHVMFYAEDGTNGGLPFALYDKQGRQLFNDSVKTPADQPSDPFYFLEDGSRFVVKFQRVYSANCSLLTDNPTCAAKVAAETDLPPDALPDCHAPYEENFRFFSHGTEPSPKERAELIKNPSVLNYPASGEYSVGKWSVMPVSTHAECQPAD